MSAIRPGTESEYSRGQAPSTGDFGPPGGGPRSLSQPAATALLAGGLVGAILLLAAEFAPLLTVHTNVLRPVVTSVATSSHDSWALVPLALLAAFLSVSAWRAGSRPALLALAVAGVVAMLIALLGDLPDTQATGIFGSATTGHVLAASSPAAGFYLETLGAALIVIVAGVGLLLSSGPRREAASA